ncbi:hypothetical protein ACTXT7_016138 [Hymenolepis weldensis]
MVFIDVLRCSDYYLHQRGGFGVMEMTINFLFNHAPLHKPCEKNGGVMTCLSLTAIHNTESITVPEISCVCITVGTSVESARPLELARQSAYRHPPIISFIDFSILVEVVSVREIPKTLFFFWTFEGVWQDVAH